MTPEQIRDTHHPDGIEWFKEIALQLSILNERGERKWWQFWKSKKKEEPKVSDDIMQKMVE